MPPGKAEHNKRISGRALWFAGLAVLLFWANTAVAIKPTPPVELDIAADETALGIGQDAAITLFVSPLVDIEAARVEFATGVGDAAITGPTTLNLGALAANESYTAQTTITLTGQGKSEVRGYIYALDAAGRELFWRSKALLLVASDGNAVTGKGGFMPLELEALRLRRTAGTLAKSAYTAELRRILSGGAIEAKTLRRGTGWAKEGTITVQGTVLWTDSAGTTHPARYVDVEIRDANGATSELVSTATTGSTGTFFASVNNDDTEGPGGRDIFIRVCANSTSARVVGPGAVGVQCIESSVTSDVAASATLTIDLTANNTDDNNRAFSVHDSLITINNYTASLSGSIPKIDTIFPTTGATSFYDGTDLNVLRDDWIDWDVVHHEYGHYFMDHWNIENNPGGSHNLTENLAETRGKTNGLALAWGEGWPTYFGTVGQIRQNASSLGVPNVGDTAYTDTIDASINYDLEQNGTPRGTGEDNEMSVQRILYDLYDSGADENDEVALGDYTVFNTANAVDATTLSEFWNRLILGATMQQKESYGCIFMDHNVSPEPFLPFDGEEFAASDPPPDFDWFERGAGPSYELNKFTVEFWNEDFTTLIFESPEIAAPPYTPSTADWTTILGGADVVKWVVEGSNTSAPETGAYLSCSRTIGGVDIAFVIDDTGSMVEEIGGVLSALTSFITAIEAEESTPTVNLITFKDNVTSRIVSDDLSAVQAQVNALFADGGGDCPEASVEALNLASDNVRAGGKVLFATDADPHPGLNLPGTIAALRGQGIRVDVLLSASCSESFKSGTYFSDSTGQRYVIPPQCNEGDCYDDEHVPKTPPDCDGPDCDTPTEPGEEFPSGAIAVFSAIAAETGGVFEFVPEVNSYDPDGATRYNNAALNIMKGIVFPSIPSVNPPRGNRNTTLTIAVTASNTNFNISSTLTFGGEGITVNSGGATSATRYQANITIAEDAELGFRNVTISTTLGDGSTETALGEGAFEIEDILSFATITSVFPAEGGLGETLDVVVTGANTNFAATSTADFGSGITVNSFTPASATAGTANITIDSDNATLGYHNVSVTTNGEYAFETVTGPFLVTATALSEGFPKLVSVDPTGASPGSSLTVAVVGENTNFEDGVSVGNISGDGITVNDTTVSSATEAEIDITIDATASAGFRDVSITTGAEVAAILDAFEVGNQAPIADAGPDQAVDATNGTATVTLDGTGSSDPDGTIAEYLWSGSPDPDDVATPTVAIAPGDHTFTLIVRDDQDALSAPDTVLISVNARPVADAGPNQTVTAAADGTARVTLDGSGSSDSDGSIAQYTWTGTPDPADTQKPSITLSVGQHTLTLVVVDNDGAQSDSDTVTITVQAATPGFQCSAPAAITGPPTLPPPGDSLVVAAMMVILSLATTLRPRRFALESRQTRWNR